MSEQDVQPAAAPEAPESPADNAPAPSATADAVTPPPEPATPEVPDWFMKDKYKSVEDQAKAQYEMSKMIGTNWGPPKDNYKMDGIEGMDPNDPILAQIQPALKEIGLSQTGFNSLVKSYQKAQIEAAKGFETEIQKDLTQDDAVAIKEVNSRLDEDFPPEVAANMKAWCMTKKDFHDLRNILSLIPRKRTEHIAKNFFMLRVYQIELF